MARTKNKSISFEDQMQRLQTLVQTLEDGTDAKGAELQLAESLNIYKEGLNIARACRVHLEKIHNEIEILNQHGDPEPFTSTSDEEQDA